MTESASCCSKKSLVLIRNRRRRQLIASSGTSNGYYRSGTRSRSVSSRRLIRMKVRRLQKLVPGGKGLQPDRLFLETANYILHLKFQVNVLQTLSNMYKL
ncbi:hypothetical protein MKW94_004644 [Papaver nudicaule]|uniref:Uncharacterized protein n=1 Tax=Papaver nudicaule TaxID=74823 RepID=A0AA41UZH9_PAPNU|nr:hypothetical protein [Papaver nudicaule]